MFPNDFGRSYTVDIRHDSALRFDFPKVSELNFQYIGDRLDVNSSTSLKKDKCHNEWCKLLAGYKQRGKRYF